MRALFMFTIYFDPRDYPGLYVVRGSAVSAGVIKMDRDPLAVVASLNEARAAIPDGLCMVPRTLDDEPQIVEIWL
jgi:hypothetical protein